MKQEDKKITTPIADFVRAYADSNTTRLHMPGHKGQAFLGCEKWDITEIKGADSLYEVDGIIAESEANATELFSSGRTVFSTEGSSQCIRAMLYLAMMHAKYRRNSVLNKSSIRKTDVNNSAINESVTSVSGINESNINEADISRTAVSKLCISKSAKRHVIIAARNVHKSFIYAVTLLDIDVIWLWPEEQVSSICSCKISPEQVERVLHEHQEEEVIAVYLTSPDYLGAQADIQAIAEVCHSRNVVLAVDNAHGAYLKFLECSQHPLDLGADICCDSAHKTLPVLTGGAYLHISKNAPEIFSEQAKYAMELFGSTSPSYLTMVSLDLANLYISEEYSERLKRVIELREHCCRELETSGWKVMRSDPLKITVEIPEDISSQEITQVLRNKGIECEYADQNYIVFMLTPENTAQDLERLVTAFGKNKHVYEEREAVSVHAAMQVISVREAMFSVPETVMLKDAENRICRVPTVSCPPAIPIAVPGELITKEMIEVFWYYGITELDVVKE